MNAERQVALYGGVILGLVLFSFTLGPRRPDPFSSWRRSPTIEQADTASVTFYAAPGALDGHVIAGPVTVRSGTRLYITSILVSDEGRTFVTVPR